MTFELFDPEQPVEISCRRLPHWYQPGVVCFTTFRTIDSLPPDALSRWHAARNDWLRRHGVDPLSAGWEKSFDRLSQKQRREFSRAFAEAYHDVLDRGCGECLLRRPEFAKIVEDSLRHFDGERYELGDFVVMPNHVHLLVAMKEGFDVVEQCRSWKQFTATQINRRHNRHGHFWQAEAFDHLVRSPEQFDYLRRYIADNPRRAKLRDGEYLLYVRPT